MFNYQTGRKVVKSVFMPLYHPKIINEALVPKRGPIILCGNHLHVWDQVPVICSTKRTIHWMAKKEYFDSNMAWMYKGFECIPVDRYNNPHESKEIAIKYLKNGEAVGIFPEGTRNRLTFAKKNYLEKLENYRKFLYENYSNDKAVLYNNEYYVELKEAQEKLTEVKKDLEKRKITDYDENDILLPFKFGAVKMAQETNSLIVPFGITGDYKVNNNNLTLRYGTPINVSNMDLEEANNILRNDIKRLVLENRK